MQANSFEPQIFRDEIIGNTRLTIFRTCGAVCSQAISITTQNGTILKVEFIGGCSGNTQGVAILVQEMSIEKAVKLLSGIDCSGRGTSCPDQLARALKMLI